MNRYSRQVRLKEVGIAGQDALARASVALQSTAFASRVEREYLVRAGVTVVDSDSAGPHEFAHSAAFRFGCCRDTAAGAWHALHSIRSILGLD